MIFPRYHQLDCVRKLEADARADGAGQQLPGPALGRQRQEQLHRLARAPALQPARRTSDEKVFDSVVVITDRRVLDQQLQDTIYQFEHKQGVVQKIDENSDAARRGPRRPGAPIIITTLQKFPFVTEKIGKLPSRRYAVIVDEAHSSQTGESATEDEGGARGAADAGGGREGGGRTEEACATYEDEIAQA